MDSVKLQIPMASKLQFKLVSSQYYSFVESKTAESACSLVYAMISFLTSLTAHNLVVMYSDSEGMSRFQVDGAKHLAKGKYSCKISF